ncbi:pyridoxal-phosphate dependent protein [Ancylostoma duodenale]|uniref:Serine racemase n=1 Tax=Ancylostoma duodenale TaxID=51022 RepID=A0A0C2GTE3_9BILA|nr:pyridoxal-phosphate dependent protein [Ancylostoma duodenale]
MVVCAETVNKELQRFSGRIHRTPVITCRSVDKVAGCNVFMKCEHLQKTGSFKARGALNAVQKLKDEGKVSGVVTHSSGNHGQSLAWAAAQVGLPCRVAIPKNAPPSKMDAMRGYGAVLKLCEPTVKSREDTCARLANELGYGKNKKNTAMESFDNQDVMYGQVASADPVPDIQGFLSSFHE